MSSVKARGLHKITAEAEDGGEAEYPRYLLDRIVEIAGRDDLVFFIPNLETYPADGEPVTDYGPHALPFLSYGGGGPWDRPPSIKGSVLRYHHNGVDEAVDCADDDLFSMGADGTAPNEPAFSLIIAVKFNEVSDSMFIARADFTALAEETEYRMFTIATDEVAFRFYDEDSSVYIGRNSTVKMVENVWYIIIGTYDGSATSAGVRLFVDGIRVDTTDTIGGVYVAMHNMAVVTSVGYYEDAAGNLGRFLDGDWYGVLQTARRLSDGGVAEGAMAADGSDVLKMTQCYRRLLSI